MSMQSVLVFGATGATGSSIAEALLASNKFDVIAAVRPSSLSKEATIRLKENGATIRTVDLQSATAYELDEAFRGADIVISAVDAESIKLQYPLVDAAKRAGVSRFVPCDFATACVRGARSLHDEKLDIQDYIKKSAVPYTFIDVGWWMQLTLPHLNPKTAPHPVVYEMSRKIYGTGDKKNAVTDLRDIGTVVARAIADDRTLNRYVFFRAEEVTQHETFKLAERISGQTIKAELGTEADFERMAKGDHVSQSLAGYLRSIFVRGDNTLENAKKDEYGGALEGRKLYPDLKLRTLEDYAKEFYA